MQRTTTFGAETSVESVQRISLIDRGIEAGVRKFGSLVSSAKAAGDSKRDRPPYATLGRYDGSRAGPAEHLNRLYSYPRPFNEIGLPSRLPRTQLIGCVRLGREEIY